MRLSALLLLVFISFFFFASPVHASNHGCNIIFTNTSFTALDGITIKTTRMIDTRPFPGLSNTHDSRQVQVVNKTGNILKEFTSHKDELANGIVLGNFSPGEYKVEIYDRSKNVPGGQLYCSNDFETSDVGPQSTGGDLELEITPNEVVMGQTIHITLLNIPKSSTGFVFTIDIRPAGGSSSLHSLINIASDKDGCRVIRQFEAWNASTPQCSKNAPYRFDGLVDSKKLAGGSPDSKIDQTFTVSVLVLPSGTVKEPSSKSFTVKPDPTQPNQAGFDIVSIAPDPGQKGKHIEIKLANATPTTKYLAYTRGASKAGVSESECPQADCTLYLFLEPTIQGDQIQIIVRDPNNNEKSRLLQLSKEAAPQVNPVCKTFDALGKCTEIPTGLGIPIKTRPEEFVKAIIGILLSLSGGIAVLIIMFSGYHLMVSRGDPEKVQGAKETITSAIVGLLFIIFSIVILQVIGVDILKIPDFKLP